MGVDLGFVHVAAIEIADLLPVGARSECAVLAAITRKTSTAKPVGLFLSVLLRGNILVESELKLGQTFHSIVNVCYNGKVE